MLSSAQRAAGQQLHRLVAAQLPRTELLQSPVIGHDILSVLRVHGLHLAQVTGRIKERLDEELRKAVERLRQRIVSNVKVEVCRFTSGECIAGPSVLRQKLHVAVGAARSAGRREP